MLQILEALQQQAALPLQRHLLPAQLLFLHPPAALLDADVKHSLLCTGLLPCHTSSPKPYGRMDGCIYQDSPEAFKQVHLQQQVSIESMDAA